MKFKTLRQVAHFVAGTPLIHKQLIRLMDIGPRDSILDIGCGYGGLLLRIASDDKNKRVKLAGIDANPEMAAESKIALAKYQTNIKIASADDLPFGDEEFDKVTLVFTMHHLPETIREKAIKETFRVLKRDGQIYLTELGQAQSISGAFLSALSLSHRCNYEGVTDQIRKHLKENGFIMITESHQFGYIYHLQASKPRLIGNPRNLKLI